MSLLAIAGLLLGGAIIGNWLNILNDRELIWASVIFSACFLGACLMGLL